MGVANGGIRLAQDALVRLRPEVQVPRYDRGALQPHTVAPGRGGISSGAPGGVSG